MTTKSFGMFTLEATVYKFKTRSDALAYLDSQRLFCGQAVKERKKK